MAPPPVCRANARSLSERSRGSRTEDPFRIYRFAYLKLKVKVADVSKLPFFRQDYGEWCLHLDGS